MIRLFSDAAVVTVVRPLASSAYGNYNLELPDYLDEEDFHQFDADGNELGYVAQFRPEVRTGGFARRFIRADVSVTAQDPKDLELEGKSDVDRVLSGARDQVAEDFFLESSIPSSGLGPWVPFVDFKVGDLVEVDILGRIAVLPVTRIEPVISDHSLVDWVVHVGGQLLNDEQERVASNEEVYRALIEDRRDLVGLQANTQRVASGLKDIEEKAVVSTLVEYAISNSETVAPTSGWVTESPTREPGEYVWFRTTTTYGSGKTSTSAPALITGNDGTPGQDGQDGQDGEDGSDGVGVTSSVVNYKASTSATAAPTGTWSSTVPTVSAGSYLWTRTVTTFSDGSTTTAYSTARQGANGSNGNPGAKGADGLTSYFHTAYANDATGSTGFSTSDASGKTYVGTYTDFTKADSEDPSKYTWQLVKGADGTNGVGVSSSVVSYQAGASATVAPTGNWVSTVPTVAAGQYLWTMTVTKFSDGATTTAYSTARQGNDGAPGQDGQDGLPGKDGVGLTGTEITYVVSTSGTTTPTSGWKSAVPTLTKGRYLWTRTQWTYSDNSAEYGYSVAYLAKDGTDGDDGLPGKDGTTLTSTAVHYAVSSSGTTTPTSGWSTGVPSATAGQFMWTRTTWTYSDSTTEKAYSVGKIGDTGAKGATGISVASVTPHYIMVTKGAKAPAQPSGTGVPSGWSKTEPAWATGKELYRADQVIYSNSTASWTTPTLVSAYTASDQAASLAGSALGEAVRLDDVIKNTVSSGNSLVAYIPGTTTPIWADGMTAAPAEENPDGLPEAYIFTSFTDSRPMEKLIAVHPSREYTLSVWLKADKPDSRIYVELRDQDGTHAVQSGAIGGGGTYIIGNMTLPTEWTKYETTIKLREAARSVKISARYRNHANGAERDAVQYMANLRIDQVVPAQADVDKALHAAAKAVTSTDVEYALSTSETVAPTSGWATTAPARTPGAYIWMRSTITYGDGRTTVTSPVLLTGNDGQDGVSVAEIAPYFRQVSNSASTPAKPAGLSPSGWSRTEPGYVSGRTLYRSERTLYTDGTITWSDVSKVGSYVVASTAMDRAQQAIDDAKRAQEGADKAVKDSKTANDGLGVLTQEVKDKIGEQGTLTQQLNNAATQKQYNDLNTRLWGDQGEINKLNTDFQSQQQAINDLNTDLWGEQGDINKLNSDYQAQQMTLNTLGQETDRAQDAAIRAQEDNIVLHRNQLNWSKWTTPVYDFVDYHDDRISIITDNDLVNVRINPTGSGNTVVTVNPGWAGRYDLVLEDTQGSSWLFNGEARGNFDVEEFPIEPGTIFQAAFINVWPYYGVEPREWAIRIAKFPGAKPQFQNHDLPFDNESFINDNGSLSFRNVHVEANQDLMVKDRFGSRYALVRAGTRIQSLSEIVPLEDSESGVVLFTHNRRELEWGYEVSRSERLISRTIPANQTVTLGSWTIPSGQWSYPVDLRFEVTWASYSTLVQSTYEIAIMIDGRQEKIIRRNTSGGMNTNFLIEEHVSIPRGSAVEFVARSTAQDDKDRRIDSGSLSIDWDAY